MSLLWKVDWTFSSRSRGGVDVPGASLDPENTKGNRQIKPLASILVECSGWDVSPFTSLKIL